MPELPETETIARDLDAVLRGAEIASSLVRRADVLRAPGNPGRRTRPKQQMEIAVRLSNGLVGNTITRVWRRAKSIVIELASSDSLVVTPRFTGALFLQAPSDPPSDALGHPFACLVLRFHDGRTLSYVDVRRLGTLVLFDATELAAWSRALGPEPLDPELTTERFSGILRGSKRAVKSILMDQVRLAGVGNIYANEACWRARVRPARASLSITRRESTALLRALRAVLNESIALRGTTFRDYRDAYGARGGFAERLRAYGRAGAPCTRCGTRLKESHLIDRRSTVWCPNCQR